MEKQVEDAEDGQVTIAMPWGTKRIEESRRKE